MKIATEFLLDNEWQYMWLVSFLESEQIHYQATKELKFVKVFGNLLSVLPTITLKLTDLE